MLLLAQAKQTEVSPAGAAAGWAPYGRAWSGDRKHLDLARL